MAPLLARHAQVQVYEDPLYGTPVFKTLSGQSKCPVENGTLSREGYKVVMEQVRAVDMCAWGF